VLPRPEVCDGHDNDCDGMADQTAKCSDGLGCREGQCTLLCKPGEFQCPAGYMCVETYCIPARCANVSCGTGQKCDSSTGLCVDVCDKILCSSPQHCKAGVCVDCSSPGEGCATGQMCVAGTCQADPCAGVSCADGTYCSNGTCAALCTQVACGAAQRCVAGKCVDDLCAQVSCPQSQYCDMATGTCKSDTCLATQCPSGQRCIQSTGKCSTDPCAFVQCPAPCFACDVTSAGTATCKFLDDAAHPQCAVVHVTTGEKGGGCTCTTGAGRDAPSSLALALAALGLVMTMRPRRRRS
jgi:MYXO-CTERM domain-containing protein